MHFREECEKDVCQHEVLSPNPLNTLHFGKVIDIVHGIDVIHFMDFKCGSLNSLETMAIKTKRLLGNFFQCDVRN